MLFVAGDAVAQKMPERSLVRKGNRSYYRERYTESSERYQQALGHDSTLFEARYNLANSLLRRSLADTTGMSNPESAEYKLKQGFVTQAEGLLQAAAADSLRTDAERATAYYNLGNAQFVQQKLQDALLSYRRSLRYNPDDMEAKYNYALTKKLLEQQQNQDQNQNQDKNQDQNQDQNQNQNQNQNQDQNNDQNKNDQDKNNQNDQNNDQNQNDPQQDNKDKNGGGGDDKNEQQDKQPPQQKPRSGMNEEQQKQLLNAIQAQEDKTQEKLDEKDKKKGILIKGKKNW